MPSIEFAEIVLVTASFVGAVLVAGLAGLLVRDRLLRRALQRRLNNARCTRCRFSLLGLPVSDGVVRCPECGSDINLAALGLKPAEIEIRQSPDSHRPA